MKLFLIGMLFFSSIAFAKVNSISSASNSIFQKLNEKLDVQFQLELESTIDRDKKGDMKGSEHELETELSFQTFKYNRIVIVNNAIFENEYGESAVKQNESVEIGSRHRFKINSLHRIDLQLMGVHFTSDEYREDKNTSVATYLELDYRWRPFSFYTLVIRPRGYKFFQRDAEVAESRLEEYRIDFSQRFNITNYLMVNLLLRGKSTVSRDKGFNRDVDDKVDFMPAIRWTMNKNLRIELFAKTRMMDSNDGKVISDDFFLYPLYGSELTVRF